MSDLAERILAALVKRGLLHENDVADAGTAKAWSNVQPNGSHQLAAYDNLSADDLAVFEAHRAKFSSDGYNYAAVGPLFMWGVVATDEPSLNQFQRDMIGRSAGQAGTDFNAGRWCFADLTSNEKLKGCTAIRADENPATVIAEYVERCKRDLESPDYTGPTG